MDADILRAVLAMNPWWRTGEHPMDVVGKRLPKEYVPRRIHAGLAPLWKTTNKAHLLVGPRQAGKTTLLWKQVLEGGRRILFLNAEDARIQSWCRSAAVFMEDLSREFGELDAVFLDEAQHLDEAGLFIKGLVDLHPGCPVLVTGSSAFHLRSRTRESLAGRATRATLLPFSARELLVQDKSMPRIAKRSEARRVIDRQCVLGGYPEVWTSPEPEVVLDMLVQAFLSRDASDFFRIRRPESMRKLIALMAGQVGNLVNYSEWASICGISRDTVADYCGILEDAHLIRLLPVFAGGRRAELTSSRKIYFLDNGIRNMVVGEMRDFAARTDRGVVRENWVFTELEKNLAERAILSYWRTRSGAEVDFVISATDGITAVEVKATPMTRPRLSRSARSFIEAYQPGTFWIVNETLEAEETLLGTRIRWVPFEGFVDG